MPIETDLPDINLDRSPGAEALYLQLAGSLRDRVHSGSLIPGTRLPSERALASMLRVSRATVVGAYRELAQAGLLESHVGQGTRVTSPPADDREPDWGDLMPPAGHSQREPVLREVLAAAAGEGAISFASGTASTEHLPFAEFQAAVRAVLADSGARALLHSDPQGDELLRSAVAGLFAPTGSGTHAGSESVVITDGSQQALDLVSRLILRPGDRVAAQLPCYLGALQAFEAAGATVVPLPADAHGLRPDLAEGVLARERPRLIYTMPTFHNPTGGTLSLEGRRELLSLSRLYHVPVLEDDPYSALRYEGTPLPSLYGLDRGRRVIHVGTMSKLLFPGLRLGWVQAPAPVVRRLAALKQVVDLHTGTFSQLVAARMLAGGILDRHLPRLLSAYRHRRDTMLEALGRSCPSIEVPLVPAGGLYLWAQLPQGLSARELLVEARGLGVAFAPGEAFYPDGRLSGRGWLRLNFTGCAADAIPEGVRRLGMALERISSRVWVGSAEPVLSSGPLV